MYNKIDDIIKKSYNSLNKTAPEELWQNISDDISLDLKIKDSYQKQHSTAPDSVWNNIKKELTIDNVWYRIKRKLNFITFLYRLRNAGFVITASVFLLGLYNIILKNEDITGKNYGNKYFVESNSANSEFLTTEPLNNPNFNSIITEESYTRRINKTTNNKKNTADVRNRYIKQNFETKKENINEFGGVAENIVIPAKYQLIPDVVSSDTLMPVTDTLRQLEKLNKINLLNVNTVTFNGNNIKKRRGLFFIGTVVNYNYTWISNNETKKAFIPNSLIADDPDYSYNTGLLLGYYLNNRSSLKSEYFFNSKIKQNYGIYTEGQFLHKEIELNYSKVSLSYNRSLLNYKLISNSSLNADFGVYFAKLINNSVKYNDIQIQSAENYTQIDYGLKFSVGQTENFKHFKFGYGIDINYGLNNIFKGTAEVPAHFDVTKTFSTGIYFNAVYVF
ncbi:MAG: PorT family protein [Bacteroidales bacterium]|nr:PorT family protein [Bacteroidales bacterium]